jgi:hypothetical protein
MKTLILSSDNAITLRDRRVSQAGILHGPQTTPTQTVIPDGILSAVNAVLNPVSRPLLTLTALTEKYSKKK